MMKRAISLVMCLVMMVALVPAIADYPAGCRFAGRCKFANENCIRCYPALREISKDHFCRCTEVAK